MNANTPRNTRLSGLYTKRLPRFLLCLAFVAVIYVSLISTAFFGFETNIASRKLTTAKAWLRVLQTLLPSSFSIEIRKVRVSRLAGDTQELQVALQAARQLQPSSPRLRNQEDLLLAQSGQLAQVERKLKNMLVEQDADLPDVCEAFINGFLLNYRFADAAGLLEVWEQDYPNSPQPKFVRGRIEEQLKNAALAIPHYEAALKLDAQRHDIRARLAICYCRQHQYKQADEHFAILDQLQIADEEILLARAQAAMDLGQQQLAIDRLNQLLVFNPKHREGRVLRARNLFSQGQYSEARAALQDLLKEVPNDYDAHYILALVLKSQREHDAAREHLDFVERADNAMASIRLAMDKTRDDPRRVDTRFEIGSQLMGLGFRQEAANWFRSVLQIDPKHIETHRALAAYYESQGESQTAQRHRNIWNQLSSTSYPVP